MANPVLEISSPVGLIAGGGVRYSQAERAVAEFAIKHGIPIIETIAGKGALTHYHPAHAGPIGIIGSTSANALAASTVNAGLALQRPELGSFKPGCAGDATIMTVRDGQFD